MKKKDVIYFNLATERQVSGKSNSIQENFQLLQSLKGTSCVLPFFCEMESQSKGIQAEKHTQRFAPGDGGPNQQRKVAEHWAFNRSQDLKVSRKLCYAHFQKQELIF